jgi:hypothetical protein
VLVAKICVTFAVARIRSCLSVVSCFVVVCLSASVVPRSSSLVQVHAQNCVRIPMMSSDLWEIVWILAV